MACINPDGTVTASAHSILTAAQVAVTVAEIAATTGLPLYRVRSSLRELVQAQLLHEDAEHYVLTKQGKARINIK
jgi:DNA-binding IclR family transcriptional regulator